ncbi:MAG: hypothetical protein Q9164_006652, partial [Protoblastenia rupestris]
MAKYQDSLSAEYISLQSRATSPSGLSYNHAVEETIFQETPPSSKSKELDHRAQTWSLLLPQTVRWLGTVTLSILLISVFWIYESKGNFTSKNKDSFNIIVTGLSVGIGINFFTAQISVALVTLTYDMVDGRNFNDTYTKHGIVNASDLTDYNRGYPAVNWAVTAHKTAHSYGERVQGTSCGSYNTIVEVVESKHDHAYYCSKNMANPEFTYRFNEYNPDDLKETYPRFTNRTITASAGECLVYEVKNTTIGLDDVDGRGAGTTFVYGNDTFTEDIQIPASSLGGNYTTYIYRGFNAPPDAALQTCGDPRCMWLWAFKNSNVNKTDDDRDPSRFYKCPITISNVTNTRNDSQIISHDTARIAAVSIALQGRWTGKPDNRNFRSYQFYPPG